MKTLKEIANELRIEIENKKRDLKIVESDQIISKLKPEDLATNIHLHPVSKYRYMTVAPRMPFRLTQKHFMTKCLGNLDKLSNRDIEAKKIEAVAIFKKRWAEMRNSFEILKNIS